MANHLLDSLYTLITCLIAKQEKGFDISLFKQYDKKLLRIIIILEVNIKVLTLNLCCLES